MVKGWDQFKHTQSLFSDMYVSSTGSCQWKFLIVPEGLFCLLYFSANGIIRIMLRED